MTKNFYSVNDGQKVPEIKLFEGFYSKKFTMTTFEKLTEKCKTDEDVKNTTLAHRDLLNRGLDDTAKKVKEGLPQAAVAFRMEGGKGKENCREFRSLIPLDFDAKKPEERLPAEELEQVKNFFRTSYHVLFYSESVSGLGCHAVVPIILPEGVVIDLENDRDRSEKIYKNAYHAVANLFSVRIGHKMDMCDNVNRLLAISHDPLAVYRPDARPIRLTREELGIGADGSVTLLSQVKSKKLTGRSGHAVAVPLGDNMERAGKILSEAGFNFEDGHHDYIVRLSFILCRMGVSEDEAAQAVDEAYAARMHHSPSRVLHSCYKTAADEFGAWLHKKPKSALQTEIVAGFLSKRADSLKYDLLTQKTLMKREDGQWTELTAREENDLYVECCNEADMNITLQNFQIVLNSSVVKEVNPLTEYVEKCRPWTPDQPDYIDLAASQVHMTTDSEDKIWHSCFRKWFIAMVAAWIIIQVVNHQVIVLIGRQGIYKSTWLRRLLPPSLIAYVADKLDITRLDKDEELKAAEFGLIPIEEIDAMTDTQLNKVKAMATTDNVNVRAPYGRHKERRFRIASYAASGNKDKFLTDLTGNRRWLPFHVESIDSPFEHELPYEGMYGQAVYLINDGFNYWFDQNEIDTLKEHVEQFMVPASEEDLLLTYFSPVNEGDDGAVFLAVAEINAKLASYGSLRKQIDPRRLGALLKKNHFKPGRRGRNGMRGYYVHEHTQSELYELRNPRNAVADDTDNADNTDIIF